MKKFYMLMVLGMAAAILSSSTAQASQLSSVIGLQDALQGSNPQLVLGSGAAGLTSGSQGACGCPSPSYGQLGASISINVTIDIQINASCCRPKASACCCTGF